MTFERNIKGVGKSPRNIGKHGGVFHCPAPLLVCNLNAGTQPKTSPHTRNESITTNMFLLPADALLRFTIFYSAKHHKPDFPVGMYVYSIQYTKVKVTKIEPTTKPIDKYICKHTHPPATKHGGYRPAAKSMDCTWWIFKFNGLPEVIQKHLTPLSHLKYPNPIS